MFFICIPIIYIVISHHTYSYHHGNESEQRYKCLLTHLSRMNFRISFGRTSLFQILVVLGGIFIFIQVLIEGSVSKQCRA